MLDPEDIEQIAQRVAELLRQRPRSKAAIRQARYRANKRHESVTRYVTPAPSDVTRYDSPRQQASRNVTVTSRPQGPIKLIPSRARDNDSSSKNINKKEEEKGGMGGESNNRNEQRYAQDKDNPQAARNAEQNRQNGNHDSESLFPEESFKVTATNGQRANRKPVLMNNKVLEELKENPAYSGIDLTKEAFKYNEWCDRNQKPQTVRRFINWINRIT